MRGSQPFCPIELITSDRARIRFSSKIFSKICVLPSKATTNRADDPIGCRAGNRHRRHRADEPSRPPHVAGPGRGAGHRQRIVRRDRPDLVAELAASKGRCPDVRKGRYPRGFDNASGWPRDRVRPAASSTARACSIYFGSGSGFSGSLHVDRLGARRASAERDRCEAMSIVRPGSSGGGRIIGQ